MNKKPYCVHVVVDPFYGLRLCDLPADEPVWVIDTETNRPVIEALRKDRNITKPLEGITSFKYDPKGNFQSWFLTELSTIDLHHGEFSHDPPYSNLNVIGVAWSVEVGKALKEHGFIKHQQTTEGFRTWRDSGQQGGCT